MHLPLYNTKHFHSRSNSMLLGKKLFKGIKDWIRKREQRVPIKGSHSTSSEVTSKVIQRAGISPAFVYTVNETQEGTKRGLIILMTENRHTGLHSARNWALWP